MTFAAPENDHLMTHEIRRRATSYADEGDHDRKRKAPPTSPKQQHQTINGGVGVGGGGRDVRDTATSARVRRSCVGLGAGVALLLLRTQTSNDVLEHADAVHVAETLQHHTRHEKQHTITTVRKKTIREKILTENY